jgi:hypothetical protein
MVEKKGWNRNSGPEFLNFSGAQESILRNQFRKAYAAWQAGTITLFIFPTWLLTPHRLRLSEFYLESVIFLKKQADTLYLFFSFKSQPKNLYDFVGL